MILLCYSAADEERKLEQVEQKKSLGSGDGGCLEANGWSLPPKFHAASDGGVCRASVPIPVYCRPVTDDPSVQVTSINFNSIQLSTLALRFKEVRKEVRWVNDLINLFFIFLV